MSYTPHTWIDGETITAEKMNNLEDGIGTEGYDGIISISHMGYDTSTPTSVSIEEGTFSDLYAKIQNNESPIILVKIWDNLNNVRGNTPMIYVYSYDSTQITFHAFGINSGGTIASYLYICWTSSDTITFD